MAKNLSARDIGDLAAYYPTLAPAPAAPSGARVPVPLLANAADPMRHIASCASCHGSVEPKLGAPRLEGLPQQYTTAQLTAFATGARRNDSCAQMRNMARQLSPAEVDALAAYCARR